MSQILSLEAAVSIWALPMFEPQCQASALPSQQWFWVPLRHLRIESRSFVYCCPRNMAAVRHQGSSYFTSVGLSPPTHCGLWERCQTQAVVCCVRHAVHRRQQQLSPLLEGNVSWTRCCRYELLSSHWTVRAHQGPSIEEVKTLPALPQLHLCWETVFQWWGCIPLFTIESSFKGQLMFLPL